IFRAHQALLADPDLLDDVHARVEGGHSAAWAWQRAVETRVADVQQLGNARLAGRAADLHDVGQRVLRLLAGTEDSEPVLPDEPVILVAEDLTPSDTAKLDPRRTLGLCTVRGGPTSHTVISARSLGIPAIVGPGSHRSADRRGAVRRLRRNGRSAEWPAACDPHAGHRRRQSRAVHRHARRDQPVSGRAGYPPVPAPAGALPDPATRDLSRVATR